MGNLPKGWVDATISQMYDESGLFSDGDWVESKDQDPNGDVRLIQLADIGVFNFRNKSSRYLTDDKAKILRCTYLEKGDILIARMPEPLGRACIFPLDGKNVTVVDVAVIRTGKDGVLEKWLMFMINSPEIQRQMLGLASGSTRQRISRKNLGTISFPLPPLPEQQRIVAKLDALFASLESTKARLERIPQLLKNFRQAVLSQAVTGKLTEQWREGKELDWQTVNLGDLLTAIKYGTSKKSDYHIAGTPILRIPNIKYGEIDCVDLKYSILEQKELDKLSLQKGDVLIIRSNGSVSIVGRTAIVRKEHENYSFAGYLVRLRPNEDLSGEFLNLSLQSNFMRSQIVEKARSTSGVNNINTTEIKELHINICNIKEQTEIVRRVESLFAKADAIEEKYHSLKQKIDSLPQAILAKAFKGELVEQLESDGDARDLLREIEKLESSTKSKVKKLRALKTKLDVAAEGKGEYRK